MKFMKFAALVALMLGSTSLYALPALQLGGDSTLTYPNGDPVWTYDLTEESWMVSATSFDLLAFATDKAWKTGDSRYAYLVAAAVPNPGDIGDSFDLSISNNSLSQTAPVVSGYGNPPLQDVDDINDSSLSPHGIYDTYFEIYEFVFDEAGLIYDLQPGEDGQGPGYHETFSITINSLLDGVTGVHFDLFTVNGGKWDYTDPSTDNDLVYKVAPFSHDAEYKIPEPGILSLFTAGLIGLALARKPIV